MPLSEESDPFGKQQKQPCTGATTAAEKAGTTDAQRAAAPAFFFLPALPGRSHCTACSSQRPPRTTCSGQHPAARPAAYHASTARLPYASIQQTAAPYCTACTLPAMQQPAPPAALPRLPDRRRARPAAPPLAMTPRPPPGAGPMTTARPHRARRYWERRFNPLRVRKPENFLGINGFLPFPRRGSEKI